MAKNSAQLEFYNHVFALSQSLGYVTHDYEYSLQLEDTPENYPFVTITDENDRTYQEAQDVIFGDNAINIHVWATADDKGKFDEIMHNLRMKIHHIEEIKNYDVIVSEISSKILIDSSTGRVLYHGILTPEIQTY